ncbi:alpha/beta fold hydrolase [Nocardia thraciensis]
MHALYGDPAGIANALRVYRANFDTSLHDPRLAALAATTETPASVPLLVLSGADDGCLPPSAFADAPAALAPGSRVEIISGAGHFMQLDRPTEVARLILDWLDER